ncbi:54S ribosomal protein L4 mitochondrial [Zygosaccharomyces mellis]|uniref:Large ribosomal subunit protein uL29m n=1 Tax=Zygosaccharomyces mellis TaxID=42258 RepID=A0A4C2E3Z5_9SACH|nr:54S ribosomal protein L4 mitochondrial [Zygosaccharomyces mellis]
MLFQRGLSTTARISARTKFTKPKPKPPKRQNVRIPTQTTHHDNTLRIQPPIPPSVANIQCPDDHPLWQFFADKKFMRSPEELDFHSRPWSIPELRRKSFEDLHSLWYTCLKERNILARENHLLRNAVGGQQEFYEQVAEKVRTTMWRIRHVLSERDWAFRNAQEAFRTEKESFVKDFEKEFLELPQERDEEAFEMLSRFQHAVFGISEFIDENLVDRRFVEGLKYVATLKLRKFSPRNEEIQHFLSQCSEEGILDVGEAFVVFTSEHKLKDVKDACSAVKDLRESGNFVPRAQEVDTVTQYIQRLVQAQSESPAL